MLRKRLSTLFSKELNMVKFHETIVELRQDHDSYIDTVCAWAELNDIEPCELVHLLSPTIVDLIKQEAITTNMLKCDDICLPI